MRRVKHISKGRFWFSSSGIHLLSFFSNFLQVIGDSFKTNSKFSTKLAYCGTWNSYNQCFQFVNVRNLYANRFIFKTLIFTRNFLESISTVCSLVFAPNILLIFQAVSNVFCPILNLFRKSCKIFDSLINIRKYSCTMTKSRTIMLNKQPESSLSKQYATTCYSFKSVVKKSG